MQQKRTIQGKKKMLEALESTMGVVTPACKKCGIYRSTYYRWLDEDPEFKQAVDDVGNVAIDFVESKLFSQVQSDNITAIIFFLKTKGKHRGYVERAEHDHRVTESYGGFISQFKTGDVE